MKCIREKVRASRQALKEFRSRRREMLVAAREVTVEPLFAELPTARFIQRLTPQERVKEAMKRGARTQKEIVKETNLNKDDVGNAIADLLLWTREIRTDVVDNERVYLINEKPESVDVTRKQSIASFSTVKGLMPVMKGEKKIGGWIAA